MALRVLVVEDSSAMRAYVRATLEESGCTVTEAASGFEALRVIPREHFDVAVVDVNMPDINGLELVVFLRKSDAHRSIPVVIISTEASARDRERGLALGADAYLSKPFEPEALLRTIEDVRAKRAPKGG